jgi:hypothetical protein
MIGHTPGRDEPDRIGHSFNHYAPERRPVWPWWLPSFKVLLSLIIFSIAGACSAILDWGERRQAAHAVRQGVQPSSPSASQAASADASKKDIK